MPRVCSWKMYLNTLRETEVMADSFGLSDIGQIAIPITNLERSTEFYEKRLGMKLLFQVPGQFSFFDNGGVRLMLTLPEGEPSDHRASIIYYKVEGLEAATDTLKSRGVTFVDEPHLIARMPDHELWMSFFEDPDGNMLAIMEEKR